jgi:hypothetical protein
MERRIPQNHGLARRRSLKELPQNLQDMLNLWNMVYMLYENPYFPYIGPAIGV